MAKRNVEKMDKSELRAACKAAGISYSKLTVQGMRDALNKAAGVYDERNGPEESEPATPAAAAPVVTAAPKVERIVQNGIRRPLPDSVCGQVWTALDQMHAAGVVPTAKDVRELAAAKTWNPNNASIEFYQWKRFMGLTQPRVTPKAKRKTVAKTAAAVLTEAAVS